MSNKSKSFALWRKMLIGALGLVAVGVVMADRESGAPTPSAKKLDQAAPPLPTIATKVDPQTLAVTETKVAEPGARVATRLRRENGLGEAARLQTWSLITQDSIRQRLKDPDSAQFRNVFTAKFEGSPVVCGEVNSKNGFGGYTGYQHFIASGEIIGFLEEETAPGEFAKTWSIMCARRG